MKKASPKKPRKRSMVTPDAKIRSALRLLWLRSPEHSESLKMSGYCCVRCGAKASKAKGRECKVEPHHVRRPNWSRIFTAIREELLQTHLDYLPLCETCHDEEHHGKN